jgi:diaminopimelate epimerase
VRLSKHHGLGNDFLVLVDLDGASPVDAHLARVVCDRRRGIGADGLIWVGPGPTMVLHNADGSRAEMSGNGIRCLGQALARERGVASFDVDVATDAGVRRLEVRPGADDRTSTVRVDMGAVSPGTAGELAFAGAKEVAAADIGNPHLVVLFADRAALDAAADGFPSTDRNVEFVLAGPGDDEVTMRVVERGVGETLACGTGACTAAWAARRWGLVGDRVTVHMPGGDALVELGDTVHLTGPTTYVGAIEYAWP